MNEEDFKLMLQTYRSAVEEFTKLKDAFAIISDDNMQALINRVESRVVAAEINLINHNKMLRKS